MRQIIGVPISEVKRFPDLIFGDTPIMENEERTPFGRRLFESREAANLTQQQAADAVGMAQGTLAEAEISGKRSGYTSQLAAVYGVDPNWLATGQQTGPSVKRKKILPDAAKEQAAAWEAQELKEDSFIPIYRGSLKLSAGVSGFAIDFHQESGPPIFFRKDWLKSRGLNHEALIALKVSGKSMEPGLFDNDLVVVNTAATDPIDGAVFAANFEGEPVIKRMKRDAGEWWLSSDNPDKSRFPDKRCSEGVFIIGRVIHKQSESI